MLSYMSSIIFRGCDDCRERAMKVSRKQAAKNRERIVEVAGRLFRAKGFHGIGIADLMKSAGLTHGGFYGHFQSKDDLAAEACGRALTNVAEKWSVAADGREAFVAAVKRYLSESHVASSSTGCVFAALAPEASRQGAKLRQTFSEGLNTWVSVLAGALTGRSKAEKRRKALAAVSEMVGALVLARSVNDPSFAKEILQAATADLTGRLP
jgi:TetR/AcrR family transcriptional repressor of nem operon